jgi:hypothetical protein
MKKRPGVLHPAFFFFLVPDGQESFLRARISRSTFAAAAATVSAMTKFPFLLSALLATSTPALAQSVDGMNTPQGGAMPGMDMTKSDMPKTGTPNMDMSMSMTGSYGFYPMSREASGTSWQPEAAPHDGIMLMPDDWMVMLHGRTLGIADSQSGPRGGNDTFAAGMVMAMATRALTDNDTLGLHAMMSIDPFMGRRGYPLLLATGETADGVTSLIDRQHPHDLFMELSASLAHRLDDGNSLFVYFGYPGEPALGPSAYMHRISGEDIPETPISHHWLDSTHVSFGVVTAGWVHEDWKLEVSQFTGREPDQFRFNFDPARFDSTSARLTFNPDPHWSLQISGGALKSPEQLTPTIDERRLTASATYYNQFAFGAVAATLAFGNKHLSDGTDESAGLLEAEVKPDDAWTLFGRAEHIGSDELVPGPRVRAAGKLSLGAIHDWRLADHLKAGLGGLYAFDFTPSSATDGYGGGAHGAMGFIRLVAE